MTEANTAPLNSALQDRDTSYLPADSQESLANRLSDFPKPKITTFSHLEKKLEAYLSPTDMKRVLDAFHFADEKHLGQFRRSGDPYISHPVAVAEICADWKLDAPAIMAALLHDVVEDQGVTIEEIIERFGPQVANMVDGLSKLEKLQFSNHVDAQGENFRKMLLAMARDIRVILIKLADRLHNMRTLEVMRSDKQHRIAQETMEVYVPVAHRLGINNLYRELQDLSFHFLYPFRYATLAKAVTASRGTRRPFLSKVHDAVSAALEKQHIHAEIYGREKTLYGIYRKMRNKNLPFKQVHDIYGFRVVVDSLSDCYLTLGVLHGLYKPMLGKVEDYIAIPKLNNYQSLHTTLIGPGGNPIEFQIRTPEMHHVAETGIAAHWLYKVENETLTDLEKHSLGWLQSLLEIQQQTGNSTEFLEHIKVDLFPDSVYVFTPKSKIIALPRAATALDFAYNIHSDVGDHTFSVKINGTLVPIRTELQNGDIVEIVTSPNAHPTPSWLEFVRTGKARSRIRSYLRSINLADSLKLGEVLFDQALKTLHLTKSDIPQAALNKYLYETGAKSLTDIYADIGVGKRLALLVSRRIATIVDEINNGKATIDTSKPEKAEPVIVLGSEGVNVDISSCCLPIPGDAIIGELNMTRGLVIHNAECIKAKRLMAKEPEKWINVDWGDDLNRTFNCYLHVMVKDEKGIIARVTAEISESDVNISAMGMDAQGEYCILKFTVQVENRIHLAQLIRRVRHIPGVKKIGRDHV